MQSEVGQTVQVYRHEQADLTLAATLTAEDTLTSPLLAGFAVQVRNHCATPA